MQLRGNAVSIRKNTGSFHLGHVRSLLLSLLLSTLFLPVAHAQLYTSNVVGTVADPSGSIVPGAKVTLHNVGTGVELGTQTNEAGNYVFEYLHPGSYTLTVEAPGFKKFVRENISLEMYAKLTVNVSLEPGSVSQSVTVRATTPLLQTETGEQSVTVDNNQVSDLPLDRSNQILNVIDTMKLLSPGVILDNSQSWTVSEGGIVRRDQDYIDGALTSQTVWSGNAINPAPDSIQEIKVMTNAFSAVYGNTGGSITVATTKSGTNQIHGDVYEYLENNILNAGDPFQHTVPKMVFNEPGFTIGGPIKKDKLFFFVDGQWIRNQAQAPFTNLTVPDPSWRTGDFSNVLGGQVGTDDLGRPIYQNQIFNYYTQRNVTQGQVDPSTGLVATATGVVRDPFPNNMIPMGATNLCAPNPTCINPAALQLQALYPNPTNPGAILQNYSTVQASFDHEHQYDVRIDYYARPQDRIMGRWSTWWDDGFGGQPFPGLGGGGLAPAIESSQNPVLDWVHSFGSSMTNDLHASYFHIYCYRVPVGYGKVGLSSYGMQGLPNANQPLGVPNIGGSGGGFEGSSGVWFLGSRYDTLELQGQADIFVDDMLSLVRGRHTIQVGGEAQRMQTNNDQPNPSNTRWHFNNDFTDQYSGTGVGSTGFDYASFLMGFPDNLQYRAFPNFADTRASVFALFAQDDFRVKPNLTLNIGLRWDAPLFWHGVNNTLGGIYTWNGSAAAFQTLGQNGFRDTQWNNNWWNFGPRIGFAWSPSRLSKTVIRGGYGLFTMGVQDGGAQGGLPISPLWLTVFDNSRYNDSLTKALTPLTTLSNIPYTPATAALNANPGITPNNNPMSTSQQWNIGVQREIPGQIMLNVAYAGAHDVHLPFGGYSPNVIPPNLIATCQGRKVLPDGTDCVPYPNYNIGSLGLQVWLGSNIYHSLQVTATKRFSNGLSFLASYTWAKNIDVGQYGYREPVADRLLDRAWDPNSVPQRFTLSYDYYLPFGPGQHWLTRGPLVPVLGGWQVSGITTLQSGFPFNVTGFNSCPGCGVAGNLPNELRNPLPSGFAQNNSHWFDPGAFSEPSLYTIGNAGYAILFGPAMSNFNVGIGKRFYFPKLAESKNLEFRADFFNAFNTPWFGNPVSNIQSGAVGQVTGTQNLPRYIQLALKFFF